MTVIKFQLVKPVFAYYEYFNSNVPLGKGNRKVYA